MKSFIWAKQKWNSQNPMLLDLTNILAQAIFGDRKVAYRGRMFKCKIIAGKVNKTNWNPPGHLLIPNQWMFLELVRCKCTGTLLFFCVNFPTIWLLSPCLSKKKNGLSLVCSVKDEWRDFHVHLQRTTKSNAYWLGVAGIFTQRAQHTCTHWSPDNLLTFFISHSASCTALFIICCILTGSVSSQWLA